MQKNISIIIKVNHNFELLEKVIWSYNTQTFRNFELLLVFQKSQESFLKSISYLQDQVFFPIILLTTDNQNSNNDWLKIAIEKATTNYILISNSNCLARPDFVEQHIKKRVEGFFLMGTSKEISTLVNDAISKEIINDSKCFQQKWLRTKRTNFFNAFWIEHSGLLPSFLDFIISGKTISLDNLSGWKTDFMLLKSYSNLKIYDFATFGIKPKSIRNSTVLLKLMS